MSQFDKTPSIEKTVKNYFDKFHILDNDDSLHDKWILLQNLFKLNSRIETGNYTMILNDEFIKCNGTFTVTLLPILGIEGKKIIIKNIGTGIITIDGSGIETIDGQFNQLLSNQYDSLTLIAGSTEWHII